MTARRGSLRHKIVRLARVRSASANAGHLRIARIAAAIAGRGLVALVALFVSVTVATQVYHVAVRNVALRQQIAQVEGDNARLAAENQKLATRVVHLADPEYLVPLIHEQLGLTKPNEVFIEVAPSTPAPADAQ
jgi:cell division protein FtsB